MKVNKFISAILIFLIIFTSLPVQALEIQNSLKYGTPSKTEWDNAMHFMIRHWHAVGENDSEENTSDDENNFVVVEGYIVPNNDEGAKDNYKFYYVNQENGEIQKLDGKNENINNSDSENGTITIPINPKSDNEGNPAEHFSGISISAGHSSIDANDDNNEVTITYHQNVHLVKAHIFYTDEKITVYGSGEDDAVFGSSENQENLQKDTAWVYTYKTDIGDHKTGDVVKGDDNKPVFDEEKLPEEAKGNVEKNKVYSTLEGLHTDKTASIVDEDDRKFNLDLEAWYSGAPLADIGLVLDSSGSMGFTSDDLQPINVKDLNLSEEDKSKLIAKELKSEAYNGTGGPSNEDWMNEIFLKEDDINLMLNPHNTDNSKLSASDYSYFIFDPRTSVNEYVPLGYWEGSVKGVKDKLIGYYEFNKGNYGKNENDKRDWLINSVNGSSAKLVNQIKVTEENSDFVFEDAEAPKDWSSDKRINLNGEKGLNIKNKDDLSTDENPIGVLLDAKPTSSNFTVSFTVQKDDEVKGNDQKYVDILFIGSKDGNNKEDYYRGIRDGNNSGAKGKSGSSSNRFKGYKDDSTSTVTNINDVFNNTDKKNITLVFENGSVKSYLNGVFQDTKEINLSDYDIIFKGFDNGYDGANLYVDNIAVFDTVLTESDVKNIDNIINSKDDKYIVCNESFCEANVEDSIGVVSNFFVGLDGGTPGWYYVNYDSEWENEYFNKDIQSCKRYWGIPKNGSDEKNQDITYTDKIELDEEKKIEVKNTNFIYKPGESTPIEFYIDEAGYLRCFFTSSTKQETAHASYVYFKDDSKYVKTEALQRALGSFTTMLDEVSPNSKISAVRFSSDKIPDTNLDKLVLLDWTDDSIEAQDIMSLERGNGGTIDGTESKVDSQNTEDQSIIQYNYGLTGGTATLTGLKSFQQNLSNHVDESADKYLIIFTDGKDSTGEEKQTQSKTIADQLKDDGYTIFAVMLTGGSVEFSNDPNSEYQQAKQFLLTLVGNSETDEKRSAGLTEETSEDTAESYFYSTAEETDGTSSIDALTKIFTDQILNRITYNLNDYTVDDYIDPRFDLVSADDEVYKLNANGKITVNKNDGTFVQYDLTQAPSEGNKVVVENNENGTIKYYLPILLSNSVKVEASARKARIYYDSEKNMYYLKWVNQTIPGCTPDSKRLSVWNARVTIKAKDDFIGGNAVLTNGNEKEMNWVYFNSDTDKSSGTEDSILPKSKDEETTPGSGTGSESESGTGEENTDGGTEEGLSGTTAAISEEAPIEDENDEYPSKGFPRVTVNVPPYTNEFSESQLIYMGEKIDKKELSEKLMLDTYNEVENSDKKYYLEYLSRYANKDDTKTLEKLKEELINGTKVCIPYYYLPNSENSNQTGGTEHKNDQLGTLEYQVVSEEEPYCPDDGIIKDRNTRKLIFTVKYIPLPIDEVEEKEETDSDEVNNILEDSEQEALDKEKTNREKQNEALVTDTYYKWDKEYKPVVGSEVGAKDLMKSEHTTNDVSGEIALQLVLKQDVREVIDDNPFTYSIDLYRNYNDITEKVGTFTATYTKDKLPKEEKTDEQNASSSLDEVSESEASTNTSTSTEGDEIDEYKIDENGNVIILAKLEYSKENEYMKENGLPIGTYTVQNPKMSYSTNLKVKLPNVITDVNEYNNELFTIGSDHERANTYLAHFGTNNDITLGYKENGENTEATKIYTDYRFGLLRVTPFTYFEMPNTGSSSLVQLYIIISISLVLGGLGEIKKKIKK